MIYAKSEAALRLVVTENIYSQFRDCKTEHRHVLLLNPRCKCFQGWGIEENKRI